MKPYYLFILVAICLCSCQSNSSKKIKLNSDSLYVDDIESKLLITPGKSVGRYYIGQNADQIDSIKQRKPDFSDAAMGKAWLIWYGKNSTSGKRNELAIYTGYRDRTMAIKEVKQIRVISSRFETADGLNNGTLFSTFPTKYADFKHLATYFNKKLEDTIKIYDSKNYGIAVEFLRDISRAITIHPKGMALDESYYTLHPELEKIK